MDTLTPEEYLKPMDEFTEALIGREMNQNYKPAPKAENFSQNSKKGNKNGLG